MFCQSCGAEVKEGLRYCNRCGTGLIAEKSVPPRLVTMTIVLSATVALVALIGFIMIFIFGSEIMSRGNTSGETVLFLIVFTLVVFGIVALIVRQLSRLLSVYLETGGAAEKKAIAQKPSGRLTEPQTASAQIDSLHKTASDGLSEQTTRKLEAEE